MEFLIFVSGFLSSWLTAVIALLLWANASLSKKNKLANLLDQLGMESESSGNPSVVTERMARVKEITVEQLALQAQVEQPQRSGLDGKHKNVLNSQIRHLEDEKVSILTTLITDGYDPILSLRQEDGTVESMRLSEFLAQQGIVVPTKAEAPKKYGKFVLVPNKSGSDDGKSNS